MAAFVRNRETLAVGVMQGVYAYDWYTVLYKNHADNSVVHRLKLSSAPSDLAIFSIVPERPDVYYLPVRPVPSAADLSFGCLTRLSFLVWRFYGLDRTQPE